MGEVSRRAVSSWGAAVLVPGLPLTVDTTGPRIINVTPAAGFTSALGTIQIDFNEPLIGLPGDPSGFQNATTLSNYQLIGQRTGDQSSHITAANYSVIPGGSL